VVFIFTTVRVSLNRSYFNKLFLLRNDGEFDINVYIIARENLFYPCKIGRESYGVRLISYNAGWAPYDVIIYKRRPAPVRYVTTQENIL